MEEDSVFKQGDLIVTTAVTEAHLATAYLRMIEEGTLDVVFHQGIPSLSQYLKESMTHGNRVTYGCFRDFHGKFEFCGLGWMYGCVSMGKYKRADMGMLFFKRQLQKTDNLTFGRMMLSQFFNKNDVDVAFGITPEPNRLAIRYAQKLGMTMYGPIPNYTTWKGELCPGWVSSISKQDWIERGSIILTSP